MRITKDIRFGLIGPGEIADNRLIPALRQVPGATFWSVTSRDAGRANAFAAKHGAASPRPAFDSLDAMLADPALDAVIIATPDKLHAPQAIAAAAAGKHVFVEKPMATNVDDALAMTAAAKAAGVRLGVAYQNRWHAGHRKLSALIAEGRLGTLRHMRVEWSNPTADAGNWRATDAVGRWWSLAALGAHCVDLVRWFMIPSSGEVREIRALFSNAAFGSPHDETAMLALRFASGATAAVQTSVVLPARRIVEIHGSEDSARCEWTLGARGEGRITIGEEELPFIPQNPYVGELADFVAAIREDRNPEVHGEEGMKSVALLVAAEDNNRW